MRRCNRLHLATVDDPMDWVLVNDPVRTRID